uniref:K Homology domain-containing protein n=1 Tax=Meloidogyne javanica TaxID=6303 RepID=A0A915MH37_MELJA
MLMQGKDVGSIIGKKGDFIRQIRENSGAKINITDGSCPERIVTISGTFAAIDQAFTLIVRKFEEIPASQCGSLIGKGGSKIREIRDKTGASLQVANEMLSNSTEKPVTISGNSEALIGCMQHVCHILLDSPAKGPTIQYKPLGTLTNILTPSTSQIALLNNQQLSRFLPVTSSSNLNTYPQQTAAFLASTLNPTLIPNNIPNLQHIETQSSTSGIPGFDPVIAALLAQQGTSSIDYASLLAAQ